VAPAWVVGVEGDIAYANEASIFHGSPYPANLQFGNPITPFGASPADSLKIATRWDASLRVRGGWLPTPSILLYITAGLAWANIDVTSTCSTFFTTTNVSNCATNNYFNGTLGPAVITHNQTNLGWTAGIGMEMLLGAHWMARVSYRFADFGYPSGSSGAFSFTDVRVCTGCASAANTPLTVSYEFLVMQHIFELGLAYKFAP
jgi:outer membrane immunogenic protein